MITQQMIKRSDPDLFATCCAGCPRVLERIFQSRPADEVEVYLRRHAQTVSMLRKAIHWTEPRSGTLITRFRGLSVLRLLRTRSKQDAREFCYVQVPGQDGVVALPTEADFFALLIRLFSSCDRFSIDA